MTQTDLFDKTEELVVGASYSPWWKKWYEKKNTGRKTKNKGLSSMWDQYTPQYGNRKKAEKYFKIFVNTNNVLKILDPLIKHRLKVDSIGNYSHRSYNSGRVAGYANRNTKVITLTEGILRLPNADPAIGVAIHEKLHLMHTPEVSKWSDQIMEKISPPKQTRAERAKSRDTSVIEESKEMLMKSIWWQLHNLLEDERIESRLHENCPGYVAFVVAAKDHLIGKSFEEMKVMDYGETQSDRLIYAVMLYIRHKKSLQIMIEAWPWLKDRLLRMKHNLDECLSAARENNLTAYKWFSQEVFSDLIKELTNLPENEGDFANLSNKVAANPSRGRIKDMIKDLMKRLSGEDTDHQYRSEEEDELAIIRSIIDKNRVQNSIGNIIAPPSDPQVSTRTNNTLKQIANEAGYDMTNGEYHSVQTLKRDMNDSNGKKYPPLPSRKSLQSSMVKLKDEDMNYVDIKKAIQKQTQGGVGGWSDDPLMDTIVLSPTSEITDENKAKYANIVAQNSGIIGKLKQAIQFNENIADMDIKNQIKGYIDRKKLHKIPIGDNKIFKRTIKKNKNSLCVGILADASGSMTGSMEIVSLVSIIFYEALIQSNDTKLCVMSHTADLLNQGVTVITEYYVEGNDNSTAMANMKSTGCNRDHVAISYMADKLNEVALPESKKIIFIICDGRPAARGYVDEDHGLLCVRETVNQLKQEGIAIIALGVGDHIKEYQLESMYDHSIMVKDIRELPKMVTTIAEKIALT